MKKQGESRKNVEKHRETGENVENTEKRENQGKT